MYPAFNAPVRASVPPELLEEIRRRLAAQTGEQSPSQPAALPAFTAPKYTYAPDAPSNLPGFKAYGYEMNRDAATGGPAPFDASYGYRMELPTFNMDAPVAESVAETKPLTPYEKAVEAYRAAQSEPVEGNRGMSALAGATGAFGDAARTGNVGYMLGAALGGGLSGLINKKFYGEAKKKQKVEQSKEALAVESALEKEQRAREEQEAQNELRRAQAEKARRPTAPKYQKDARGRLWLPDPDDPTKMRQVTDETGKVMDAKFERPYTIPYLLPDGVSYGTAKYNPQTDTYEPVDVNGQPAVSKQSQPIITEGENKGRTPQQVAQDREREADRDSRERIARWQITSRDTNARLARKIQQDRLKLGQTQFQAKYPGYGKPPLTKDYIIQKAKSLKMLPEDVAKQAIQQGYTIED